MNFIGAEVTEASATAMTVRLKSGTEIRAGVDAAAAKRGDKVTLGIRPEHFDPNASSNVIEAKVTFVESLGSTTHAYLAYPDVEEGITCDLGGHAVLATGDALKVGLPAENCHVFDAEGKAFRRHFKLPERHAA
jgi:multiple sugar transport system ATP-binding protein